MSIPGAERSAAQPLSGRYTSLVTQGHSFSTLRDDQQKGAYTLRPQGRGGYAKRITPLPRNLLKGSRCAGRSEEHTSELQSRRDLVCRLLLEKKNYKPFIFFL